MSRFCIIAALDAGLMKSPLVAGLAKLEMTGRRDPGQPFTADEVSVNRELQACGFYSHNHAIIITVIIITVSTVYVFSFVWKYLTVRMQLWQ